MRNLSLLTIAAATLAGFSGGLASQWLGARVVHAQMIPNELTGRKLVLVNEKGKPYGRIDMGPEGGEIKLYDPSGKNIWQAPFHFGVTPTDSGAKPH